MKKLILLAVAVVAVWLGINYARTGRLALFPSAASPAEQRVHDLEQELAAVESQISSAGRAAGVTGMDTTGDVSSLTARKEQIEKQLAEARKATGH
jgi:capsule polysaccharide export protein KpsE/RkpR